MEPARAAVGVVVNVNRVAVPPVAKAMAVRGEGAKTNPLIELEY